MSKTAWNGGAVRWHANARLLMHGPEIVKVCLTKTGARFAVWRRRRAEESA